AQARKETGFVTEHGACVVVGMASLPVGKNDHARPLFANDTRNFQPIVPGVLHLAVRDVESAAETDLQDAGGIGGFAGTILRGAPRPHFALREVENAGAQPALRHLEEGSTARLLNVITVRGNGQNIQSGRAHSNSPASRVTFSLTMSRCAAISWTCGRTRFTC